MFTTPRVNVIASDEGFSVEVLGRTGLEYKEGDRTMFVDSEVLAGPNDMAIFSDSITKWKKPHDDEFITSIKKAEIIDNICRAFEYIKAKVEVLPPSAF